MRAFVVCTVLVAAATAWVVWREHERAANRADAYREIRRRPRLSETPAMRRLSEWVPD